MKLSDYLDAYYTHTGNASAVARQAAFAGIAIIWIFNQNIQGVYFIPKELLWPTIWLVAGLGLDLLQYILASAIWGGFHYFHECGFFGKVDREKEIEAPEWLNWPSIFCFWSKLISISIGYVFVLAYAKNAINAQN